MQLQKQAGVPLGRMLKQVPQAWQNFKASVPKPTRANIVDYGIPAASMGMEGGGALLDQQLGTTGENGAPGYFQSRGQIGGLGLHALSRTRGANRWLRGTPPSSPLAPPSGMANALNRGVLAQNALSVGLRQAGYNMSPPERATAAVGGAATPWALGSGFGAVPGAQQLGLNAIQSAKNSLSGFQQQQQQAAINSLLPTLEQKAKDLINPSLAKVNQAADAFTGLVKDVRPAIPEARQAINTVNQTVGEVGQGVRDLRNAGSNMNPQNLASWFGNMNPTQQALIGAGGLYGLSSLLGGGMYGASANGPQGFMGSAALGLLPLFAGLYWPQISQYLSQQGIPVSANPVGDAMSYFSTPAAAAPPAAAPAAQVSPSSIDQDIAAGLAN